MLKTKIISKRILTGLMALILVAGSFVPLGTIEADAASTKSSFTFDRVMSGGLDMGYHFHVTSGPANGANGTCADPGAKQPKDSSTGYVWEIPRTNLISKTAYFLWKNQIYPNSTGTFRGYTKGTTAHVMISVARARVGYAGSSSLSWVKNKLKSMNFWAVNTRAGWVDEAAKLTVPETFHTYYVQNTDRNRQDGVVWKYVENGKVNVKKTSTVATTSKLSNYNFGGCEYTLYKSDKKTKVGTIKVYNNGTSNTLSVQPGTYYVKESKKNNWYKLNTNWSGAGKVVSGKTFTFNVKDNPETAPVKITKKLEGDGVIPKGATFTFKLVHQKNKSITYTFSITGNGAKTASVTKNVYQGTYDVTETSATGIYKWVDKTKKGTVTAALGKTGEIVWTNAISDGSVKIHKESTNSKISALPDYTFEGIEYTLYNEDKTTEVTTFTLNKDGDSETKVVKPGSYFAKETKTNAYYALNDSFIPVTVKAGVTTVANATGDYADAPNLSEAEIIKKESEGHNLGEGDTFTFKLVNVDNPNLTYRATVTGTGESSASTSVKVPAGTYRVTEDDVSNNNYEDVTEGPITVTVPIGGKGTVNWENKLDRLQFGLNVVKSTDDGGPKNGFQFKVEGEFYNQGAITAKEILETANPSVELNDVLKENYELGEWTVNEEDLEALNNAAANRQPEIYTVRIANKLTKKEAAAPTEPTESETPVELPEEVAIEANVKVNLKDVVWSESNNKYESKIENATPNISEATYGSITLSSFDWLGAATTYTDPTTGEPFTILTTKNNGKTDVISDHLAKGKFTVTEILTDEQAARYFQPESQTKEIKDDESNVVFTFKFTNKAKTTTTSLKKTSPNRVVSNIKFRLTGTTAYGDEVTITDKTDKNGNINFGKLHAGEYVVEELNFDSKNYINNHALTGYENPAMMFKITGEEEAPVVVEFDNKPITALYIAKVDASTYSFIENADFELYEDGKKVAAFQIVANDDGTAGINMKWSDKGITGKMVKTLTETVVKDDEEVIATGEIDPADVDLDSLNWARIENLQVGKTYTLKEIKAPTGFIIDKDKTFKFEDRMRVVVENRKPTISTTATDAETKTHTSKASETTTIIDTVEYKGLYPGDEYVMKGTLMDAEDEQPVMDGDKPVTAEKTFTASETGSGTVDLTFTFNSSALEGQKVVAFESLYEPKLTTKAIATHEDITDKNQTVNFPVIGTEANRATEGAEQKVTDSVECENLVEGETYTVSGVLMDKDTEKPVTDKDGKEVTATKTFKATEPNMTVELAFEFTNKDMLGKTGVVFEDLISNGKIVASHKDIEDPAQTVTWPSPHYNMWKVRNEDAPAKAGGKYGFFYGDKVTYDVFIFNDGDCEMLMDVADAFVEPEKFTTPVIEKIEGASESSVSEDKTIGSISVLPKATAVITFSAIVKDNIPEYLADAAKDSDSLRAIDETHEGVDCNRAEKSNTPDDNDGYVNIARTFNVKYKDPKDTAPREYPNGDKRDDAQTPVQKPQIGTNAIDKETADHISYKGDKITVIDEVTYAGLTKGKSYTLKGEFKNKATGQTVATAERHFVAEASRGLVEVEFTFSSKGNERFVAFEELYDGTTLIASHKDINDEDQSVRVPEIGTKANLGKKDVVDEIGYKNLLENRNYVARGYLVNEKGEKLKGSDGETKFTAKKSEGSVKVTMPIKFELAKLSGMKLVAFEEVYIIDDKGTETIVAVHKDINDMDQSVQIPKAPSTGDTPMGLIYSGLGLIAAAGIGWYAYKNKFSKKDKK